MKRVKRRARIDLDASKIPPWARHRIVELARSTGCSEIFLRDMALKSGLVAVKEMLSTIITATDSIEQLWNGSSDEPAQTRTDANEVPIDLDDEQRGTTEINLDFEGFDSKPSGSEPESTADGSSPFGERPGHESANSQAVEPHPGAGGGES